MNNPPSGLAAMIGATMIGLLPPVLLVWEFHTSTDAFLLGAAAWVLSLAVKIPVAAAVSRVLKSNRVPMFHGAALGLLSSSSELGIAAWVFANYALEWSVWDVVLFGVGASSVEVAYVLARAITDAIRHPDQEALDAWMEGARVSLVVRNMLAVERLVALIGHVGSRGLIFVAYVSDVPLLAVVAVLTFALVDGIATYGRNRAWNWYSPKTATAFYGFTGAVGVGEMFLFSLTYIAFIAS